MEQNDTPDPFYQKGFNEGYVIAKYLPEFNIKPNQGLENSNRGMGFQDGQKQYVLEKDNRLPSWLKKNNIRKENAKTQKNRDDLKRE